VRAYLFVGCGFGIAAALQPGPLQAFLFSRVTRAGWVRTLPAAFAPIFSDGPIAAFVLLVLVRVPQTVQAALQLAGGVLLLYLGIGAYRDWRRRAGESSEFDSAVSAPRTIAQAVAINIFNPNPYLGWSLVLGPEAMNAWRQAPRLAVIFVAAFYITMVATIALTIVAFGATRAFGPRAQRTFVLVSAVLLASIGVLQLVDGIRRLRG
jgi:threonine/homoserine/homoserine lactone efflux protein